MAARRGQGQAALAGQVELVQYFSTEALAEQLRQPAVPAEVHRQAPPELEIREQLAASVQVGLVARLRRAAAMAGLGAMRRLLAILAWLPAVAEAGQELVRQERQEQPGR